MPLLSTSTSSFSTPSLRQRTLLHTMIDTTDTPYYIDEYNKLIQYHEYHDKTYEQNIPLVVSIEEEHEAEISCTYDIYNNAIITMDTMDTIINDDNTDICSNDCTSDILYEFEDIDNTYTYDEDSNTFIINDIDDNNNNDMHEHGYYETYMENIWHEEDKYTTHCTVRQRHIYGYNLSNDHKQHAFPKTNNLRKYDTCKLRKNKVRAVVNMVKTQQNNNQLHTLKSPISTYHKHVNAPKTKYHTSATNTKPSPYIPTTSTSSFGTYPNPFAEEDAYLAQLEETKHEKQLAQQQALSCVKQQSTGTNTRQYNGKSTKHDKVLEHRAMKRINRMKLYQNHRIVNKLKRMYNQHRCSAHRYYTHALKHKQPTTVSTVKTNTSFPSSTTKDFYTFRRHFYKSHMEQICNSLTRERDGKNVTDIRLCPIAHPVRARFLSKVRQLQADPIVTFHGTHIDHMQSIIDKGLLIPGKNNNVTIRNGRAFGVGIYSSKTASYSLHFTQNTCTMFVCAAIDQNQRNGSHLNSITTSTHSIHGNIVVNFQESDIIPLFLLDFTSDASRDGHTNPTTINYGGNQHNKLIRRIMKTFQSNAKLYEQQAKRLNHGYTL